MSREHFLQNQMAGPEDSFVDLLRVTMANQNVVQDLAEKLRTRDYTVPMLLLLSDSELEGVIDEVLPAASRAQRLGIKSAIRARLSMQGSSSRPPYAMDENLMKKLNEFLDEAEVQRKSKKSFSISISGIRSSEWDALGEELGYSLTSEEIKYTPTHMSDLPPFGWDDRLEKSQADRYITHLNKIRKARLKWTMINAANNYPNLLSGQRAGHLIRGTTDVAVIGRGNGTIHPNACLRCIFQLEKNNILQGRLQILLGLVMANYFSSKFRPFAVLTDLRDDWVLYWMDGSIICFTRCESRAVAVGIIEDLLGDDQDIAPSSGLPFLSRDFIFAQNSKRQKYMSLGTENIEDLEGFIPDDEILNARVDAGLRHLHQMLQGTDVEEEGPVPEGKP